MSMTYIPTNKKTVGYLERRGKLKFVNSWKKYWFVLEGHLLLHYGSKDDYDSLSSFKGSITLAPTCSVKPYSSEQFGFQINTRCTTVTLRAENITEQTKWMQAILTILNQNQNTNKTPTKLNHFRYSTESIEAPLNSTETGGGISPTATNIDTDDRQYDSPASSVLERLKKAGARSYGNLPIQLSDINKKPIERNLSLNVKQLKDDRAFIPPLKLQFSLQKQTSKISNKSNINVEDIILEDEDFCVCTLGTEDEKNSPRTSYISQDNNNTDAEKPNNHEYSETDSNVSPKKITDQTTNRLYTEPNDPKLNVDQETQISTSKYEAKVEKCQNEIYANLNILNEEKCKFSNVEPDKELHESPKILNREPSRKLGKKITTTFHFPTPPTTDLDYINTEPKKKHTKNTKQDLYEEPNDAVSSHISSKVTWESICNSPKQLCLSEDYYSCDSEEYATPTNSTQDISRNLFTKPAKPIRKSKPKSCSEVECGNELNGAPELYKEPSENSSSNGSVTLKPIRGRCENETQSYDEPNQLLIKYTERKIFTQPNENENHKFDANLYLESVVCDKELNATPKELHQKPEPIFRTFHFYTHPTKKCKNKKELYNAPNEPSLSFNGHKLYPEPNDSGFNNNNKTYISEKSNKSNDKVEFDKKPMCDNEINSVHNELDMEPFKKDPNTIYNFPSILQTEKHEIKENIYTEVKESSTSPNSDELYTEPNFFKSDNDKETHNKSNKEKLVKGSEKGDIECDNELYVGANDFNKEPCENSPKNIFRTWNTPISPKPGNEEEIYSEPNEVPISYSQEELYTEPNDLFDDVHIHTNNQHFKLNTLNKTIESSSSIVCDNELYGTHTELLEESRKKISKNASRTLSSSSTPERNFDKKKELYTEPNNTKFDHNKETAKQINLYSKHNSYNENYIVCDNELYGVPNELYKEPSRKTISRQFSSLSAPPEGEFDGQDHLYMEPDAIPLTSNEEELYTEPNTSRFDSGKRIHNLYNLYSKPNKSDKNRGSILSEKTETHLLCDNELYTTHNELYKEPKSSKNLSRRFNFPEPPECVLYTEPNESKHTPNKPSSFITEKNGVVCDNELYGAPKFHKEPCEKKMSQTFNFPARSRGQFEDKEDVYKEPNEISTKYESSSSCGVFDNVIYAEPEFKIREDQSSPKIDEIYSEPDEEFSNMHQASGALYNEPTLDDQQHLNQIWNMYEDPESLLSENDDDNKIRSEKKKKKEKKTQQSKSWKKNNSFIYRLIRQATKKQSDKSSECVSHDIDKTLMLLTDVQKLLEQKKILMEAMGTGTLKNEDGRNQQKHLHIDDVYSVVHDDVETNGEEDIYNEVIGCEEKIKELSNIFEGWVTNNKDGVLE